MSAESSSVNVRGVSFVESLGAGRRIRAPPAAKAPRLHRGGDALAGLGIGANTAIFTPDRRRDVAHAAGEGPRDLLLLTHGTGASFSGGFTYQQYRSMREQDPVRGSRGLVHAPA